MILADKRITFFKSVYDKIQFMKAHSDQYSLIGLIEELIVQHYVLSITHSMDPYGTSTKRAGWQYTFIDNGYRVYNNTHIFTNRLKALEEAVKYQFTEPDDTPLSTF